MACLHQPSSSDRSLSGVFTLAAYHVVQGGIGLGANHGATIGHQLDVTCQHDLYGFLDVATHDLRQSGLRPCCDLSQGLTETGPGEGFVGGLLRVEIEFCYFLPSVYSLNHFRVLRISSCW